MPDYASSNDAGTAELLAATEMLKAEGLAPQRLKMAAICSVCAENFAKHMNQFSEALIAMRSAGAKS